MRFGVCCSLEQAPAVMAAGFDYVELQAGTLFGSADEPAWNRFDGLSVEATNVFVAGELKLVGPDKGDVLAYAQRVVPRAAKVGVKVVVIGSGTARRSPAGYDLDAAESDFIDSAATVARVAKEHGLVVAPESLTPAETNVGIYLGDLARMLAHRGVAYTADSYHVLNQPGAMPDDPAYWVAEMPHTPVHVHFGTRDDRTWRVAEAPEVAGFVARLKDLGYDGRVSLECAWGDFEAELPEALAQVKGLFAV